MSKEKLENILVYIDDVEYIVSHYGGVINTLNDRIGKQVLIFKYENYKLDLIG